MHSGANKDFQGCNRRSHAASVGLKAALSPGNAKGPFSVASYRRQWLSDLLTSFAFEIESLALAWYVLVETKSVMLMAAIASLQYLGTLVSPLLGVAGDRFGQLRTLRTMRLYYAGIALLVLGASTADLLNPWIALVAATASGLIRPSDLGMRNVVTSGIVPKPLLLPAVSLSRATGELARIGGALAGAAWMATLGIAWAYAAALSLYLIAAVLIGMLKLDETAIPVRRMTVFGQLKDAIRSVGRAPAQKATMLLALFVNFTAFPFLLGLLPYVAKDRFMMDEMGLGVLISVAASGGLASSVLLARFPIRRPAATMFVFSVGWHALTLIFALQDSLPLALIALFFTGLAQGMCMTLMAAFLVGNVDPKQRGSVMGLRSMAIYGLPLGLTTSSFLLREGLSFPMVAAIFAIAGTIITLTLWGLYKSHFQESDATGGAF